MTDYEKMYHTLFRAMTKGKFAKLALCRFLREIFADCIFQKARNPL